MSASEPNSSLLSLPQRIESFVRRLFERLGAVLDRALGGNSGTRTEPLVIAQRVEREIEKNLRREGDRLITPNVIELLYDFETFKRTPPAHRDALQQKVRAELYEYVLNHRYTTLGPLQVKLGFDAFVEGIKIRLSFDETKAQVAGAPAAAQLAPARKLRCDMLLQAVPGSWQASAVLRNDGTPISLGRNSKNEIRLDDETVSSYHAAFVLKPDGTLELTDRGSSNGTCVNGVLLDPANRKALRHGDRLQFGDFEMTISVKLQEEN